MTQPGPTTELAVLPPYQAESLAPLLPEEQVVSPIASAKRILRGRYKWAIGIGAVLAAIGMATGYKMPQLTYRSVGMIRVVPVVKSILYRTEDNGALASYDAYVESQTAVVTSRRVIDNAMNSNAWIALGRGLSDEAVSKFIGQLSVSHPYRTEHIVVSVSDESPQAAMIAVNEIIDAYMKIVEEAESSSGQTTVDKLTEKRTITSGRLADLRSEELDVTDGLGEPALRAHYTSTITELEKLAASVQDIELEIAALKVSSGSVGTAPAHVPTPKELAINDPALDSMLSDKLQVEDHIKRLTDGGLGENHPDRKTAQHDLELVERQIAERAQTLRIRAGTAPDARDETLRAKEAMLARYEAMRLVQKEEATRLGKLLLRLSNIQADRAILAEQLDMIQRRLQQINMESEHSRTTVLSRGDRPVRPDGDKRISYAVLGGVGGMAGGFLLVLLWGLRSARVRHIVDMNREVSRGRFLGVFPELPDPAAATAKSVIANPEINDHCLHHVRAMLQLRNAGQRRVVVLTSASPGAGKTTLSLALGMSFAATGSRTLLVDCDLVGHGLTSAARALFEDSTRRALDGQSGAAPAGSLTSYVVEARRSSSDHGRSAKILADARERAQGGDAAFAESVRRLELLARRDESALNGNPARNPRGIIAALRGARLDDCLVQFDGPNLTLLPAGDAILGDAQALSMRGLSSLLAACAERFDMILVDTGPVLGSIEALFVSAAADQVVVVVPRGESQTVVDEALERLERLGADVAGVVFNRALNEDAMQSSYSSRSVSVSVEAA